MPSKSDYRKDIDGLRAIAILVVVFYHAHVPGFSGGFVGVDIFFVISGYVITALLLRESEVNKKVSISDFYARRIRRLLPALALVVLSTLILSLVFLSPIGGEQQGVARSAIAAAVFASNFYFLIFSGGYFDGPTEEQPLLHIWSLSVEEQFYLVWPLLIWITIKLCKTHDLVNNNGSIFYDSNHALKVIFSLVFSLSLFLCLYISQLNPQAAFFLPVTRAWEFAAGGLVFVFFRQKQALRSELLGHALALFGFAAIVFSVYVLNDGHVFPGFWAIIPVAGTVALIIGCQVCPSNPVTKFGTSSHCVERRLC